MKEGERERETMREKSRKLRHNTKAREKNKENETGVFVVTAREEVHQDTGRT